MGGLVVQLVPPAIGSAAMPTWVLLVFFLLRQGKGEGPAEAVAFVAGITGVRLLQGVLFGTVLNAYDIAQVGHAPGVAVSTLLLITGLLLWVTALKQTWQEDDVEGPLPRLLDMLPTLTPLRALGLGALLVITSSRAWLFTLSALGIVNRAGLGSVVSIVAYLLYITMAQALLVVPILIAARAPDRLDAAADWLATHDRPIMIGVSLVVGGFFLWRGLVGLLG